MSDNVIPFRHACNAIKAVRSLLDLPATEDGVTVHVDRMWTCSCGRVWHVRSGQTGWYAASGGVA